MSVTPAPNISYVKRYMFPLSGLYLIPFLPFCYTVTFSFTVPYEAFIKNIFHFHPLYPSYERNAFVSCWETHIFSCLFLIFFFFLLYSVHFNSTFFFACILFVAIKLLHWPRFLIFFFDFVFIQLFQWNFVWLYIVKNF